MTTPVAFDKILFFDIETVPMREHFDDLTPEMQARWTEKHQSLSARMPNRYGDSPIEGFVEAGIFAEFAKIVCISAGFIHHRGDAMGLRVKSFANDDERMLLKDFSELLYNYSMPQYRLCGHNIREFDVPFVCRRLLINGLPLPPVIDMTGRKPWETQFLDTLELWRFGDIKNYTPLKLLTAVFGIPTPKDDIDGSQVAAVYYGEHDLKRIAVYCEKDVIATAQLYLRYCGQPLIASENIEHV